MTTLTTQLEAAVAALNTHAGSYAARSAEIAAQLAGFRDGLQAQFTAAQASLRLELLLDPVAGDDSRSGTGAAGNAIRSLEEGLRRCPIGGLLIIRLLGPLVLTRSISIERKGLSLNNIAGTPCSLTFGRGGPTGVANQRETHGFELSNGWLNITNVPLILPALETAGTVGRACIRTLRPSLLELFNTGGIALAQPAANGQHGPLIGAGVPLTAWIATSIDAGLILFEGLAPNGQTAAAPWLHTNLATA